MRHSLRASGLAASAACFAVGCVYGFAGGGLPGHIETVAIVPFENLTPEPALAQEVGEAVRDAMERRLGLRIASEGDADAIVRGRILRYAPDIPLAIQGGERVAVTRRRVQLTLDIEIYDQQEDRALWERNGLIVDGEYDPPQEEAGRVRALEKLVTDLVDGAQSQW
jgi:hypothetical protein